MATNVRSSSRPGTKRFAYGFRSVGETARPLFRKMQDERVLLLGRILRDWDRMVGGEVARRCRPVRIARQGRKHLLHVRVEGAFATEFGHQAASILERLQASLGKDMLAGLRVTQIGGSSRGGILRRAVFEPVPRSVSVRTLDPEACRRRSEIVGAIRDPGLRDSLARFLRVRSAEQ